MDIASKIKILSNEVSDFSIFLNREILIQVDTQLKICMDVQIVLFQDDEKNFKMDAEVADWTYVIFHGKKIAGYENIREFGINYNKLMNFNLSLLVDGYINEMYKKYDNNQIIELAKEYKICLP